MTSPQDTPLPSVHVLGELSLLLAQPGTINLQGPVERAYLWLNTWLPHALPWTHAFGTYHLLGSPSRIAHSRTYLRDVFDWPLLLACADAGHTTQFAALIFQAGLSADEAADLTDTPAHREHLTALAALRGTGPHPAGR